MGTVISEELSVIFNYAREEAMRTGAYQVGTDHLLLGLLRHGSNSACNALESSGISLQDFKHYVESQIFKRESVPYCDEDKLDFSREAKGTLNMMMLEASGAGNPEAKAVHLLLAVSRKSGCASKAYLDAEGITHDTLAKFLREPESVKMEKTEKVPSIPRKKFLHIVIGKPKIYS